MVPLLVRQVASARMHALHTQDPDMAAWWGTTVECVSAIARLEREGLLSPASSVEAFRRLEGLHPSWYEIEPGEELRDTAKRFLRIHSLSASDALQLAAAFVACERRPERLELLSLDERLCEAARREGFILAAIPPTR